MNAIEKRAREILDSHVDGYWLEDQGRCVLVEEAVTAIIAALTPPEGYVLVPVEPTMEMLIAAAKSDKEYQARNGLPDIVSVGPYDHYVAMLAARPEVGE